MKDRGSIYLRLSKDDIPVAGADIGRHTGRARIGTGAIRDIF